MAFLSPSQIQQIGFLHTGNNILISDKASIYNPGQISIGDNCRVDDFCILSAGTGGISLGRNVHLACYVSLIGKNKIVVDDFSGISARASIFSSSDDFSGDYLTGPTVNEKYRNVHNADVIIYKHVIIGSGALILPGVTIGEAGAVAALSQVTTDVEPYTIVGGVPAIFIKSRSRKLLDLENDIISAEFNAKK